MPAWTHYLPILTTVISTLFAVHILGRYAAKPTSKQLLWWGIGIITYGAGTLVESLTTIMGWHEFLFKSWYILGALLGGAPLAVGSIYLLLGKKAGNIAVILLVTTVTITSVFVILSPIDYSLVDPAVPNGKVLVWHQVRMVSPFVNSLAALFLIGGAIYSAVIYFYKGDAFNRFIGNLLIALGAILPGIGGYLSRLGHTEDLYIAELVGLILIWYGYRYCQRPTAPKPIPVNIA